MGARNKIRAICFGCLTLAAAAGQTPEASRVAEFKQKVLQDMTTVPNYTCLETITRTRREPHGREFKPVDTIRLEVSSVAGKELFAWPGSREFEDRDVRDIVSNGVMGTGMFSTFAQRLFVEHSGEWQCAREESLDSRTAVRCDFHLTAAESQMDITANVTSERVATKGSFWFDPASLDLIRLQVDAEGLPYDLGLESTEFRTDYARVRIGAASALLPKESELTMIPFASAASRNEIDFSACHEYLTQSSISFDVPATLPEAPKPQVRDVDLPAGLTMTIELDAPIDSKTAAVGDVLHAHTVEELQSGSLTVPAGATLTGNLCKLDRGIEHHVGVCVRFSEINWPGARAAFYAELMDLDRKSAGSHRPMSYYDGHSYRAAIDRPTPGEGMFYMDSARFTIAKDFRMVWRTLPASGAAR